MRETVAQNARRLRLDRRSYGDHGFRGRALKAWHEQRADIKQVLRLIENDRRRLITLTARGFRSECPRTFGRGGTDAGEQWVEEAWGFVVNRTDYYR